MEKRAKINYQEIGKRILAHVQQEIQRIVKQLEAIDQEIEEIQKQIEEIESQGTLSGWIEWKWVRNKVGKKYWYYYYRYRSGGKVKSVYIGKFVNPELRQAISRNRIVKALRRRIKVLQEEKARLLSELERLRP